MPWHTRLGSQGIVLASLRQSQLAGLNGIPETHQRTSSATRDGQRSMTFARWASHQASTDFRLSRRARSAVRVARIANERPAPTPIRRCCGGTAHSCSTGQPPVRFAPPVEVASSCADQQKRADHMLRQHCLRGFAGVAPHHPRPVALTPQLHHLGAEGDGVAKAPSERLANPAHSPTGCIIVAAWVWSSPNSLGPCQKSACTRRRRSSGAPDPCPPPSRPPALPNIRSAPTRDTR